MLSLHLRHVCWGQPQLVLLSGTSTSTSPWEKTECWLNWIYSLFLPWSKNLIRQWRVMQLFADLPPDRWGEMCPHIGILGVKERNLLKIKLIWVRDRDITSLTQHTQIGYTAGVCICVCGWMYVNIFQEAFVPLFRRDHSLNIWHKYSYIFIQIYSVTLYFFSTIII